MHVFFNIIYMENAKEMRFVVVVYTCVYAHLLMYRCH